MIVGHQKQWQFLRKSAETGRISHAYLFVGQAQLGKKTLAIEFVEWLLIDEAVASSSPFANARVVDELRSSPPSLRSLHSLRSVNENIQGKQHPDFIFVEPQKGEIQISQIREFIRRLSFKPLISPFKAAIIDQAHCMNQEAQNCLLKTLEEPKGRAVLILITEYPETLFPTILSRCEIIKFYPVRKIEIKKYLERQGIPSKELEELIRSCMGRPGAAIDFISDPQKLENQRKAIKDLIKFSNSELSTRFQYVKDLSQAPQNLREILDIWLGYFRNVLLAMITDKEPSSTERRERSERSEGGDERSSSTSFQFNNYSSARLRKILKLIQRINFLIAKTNVNPKLALEILAIEL